LQEGGVDAFGLRGEEVDVGLVCCGTC
jgi:hypothetical protein